MEIIDVQINFSVFYAMFQEFEMQRPRFSSVIQLLLHLF